MKLLNYNLGTTLEVGNVKVEMLNDTLTFSIDEKYYLEDSLGYTTGFCYKLSQHSFSNILIGGLGLGLIPFYIHSTFENIEIDVLENNPNVIEVVNQMGYLPNDVNIIQDDALSHSSLKQYDLVLMDLWWFLDNKFTEDKTTILSNYSENITSQGKFYFPLSDELI